MDDTNPDAKEATCNGCFLQICFPATCPDLSCIGQFIILPIAFKDPPPWLFQSDIGSTILQWEEGSHWTMARWWNKVLNTVLSYAHFTGLLDVFARFLFEIQILELGHRVTLSTYKRWVFHGRTRVGGCGGIAQTVLQVLVPTDWNFNQVGRFSEINDMMMDCMIAGSNCDGSAKQSDLRTPWCTQ